MSRIFSCKRLLPISVIVGSFLLNLPMGISWVYGNMSTYTTSYFIFRDGPNGLDIRPEWMLTSNSVMGALGISSVDLLVRVFGLNLLQVLGVAIFDLCVFLTYFTVQKSVGLTLLTFMFVGSYMAGMISMCGLKCASKVASQRVGLISSIVSSAMGLGAGVNNYLTIAYVNPDNLSPNVPEGNMVFFSQRSLLQKVPGVFIVIGIYSVTCHVLGLLFQQVPIHCADVTGNSKSLDVNEEMPVLYKSTRDYEANQGQTFKANEKNTVTIEQKGDIQAAESEVSTSKLNDEVCQDLKPLQVLQTRSFYLLALSLVVISYSNLMVLNYYKPYGQLWIKDDDFLTTVGSMSTIIVCIYRLLIGIFIDKFGVKNTIIATLTSIAIVTNAWYFAPRLNRWLYALCCLCLVGLNGSIYILFPVAALKMYGPAYYSTNWGLLLGANVITALALPFALPVLLANFGWFGVAIMSSILALCAVACVVCMLPGDNDH